MNNESISRIYYYRAKNWVIENENIFVLTIGILLIIIISFGLGALWQGSEAKKSQITVDKSRTAFGKQNQEVKIIDKESGNKGQDTGISKVANILYVASKNGTSYHLLNCPGAKQIKPENKILFQSKEEAEIKGYKPAGNCPGILR